MLCKLTEELLEKIVNEVKKPENMSKIHNNIIDPLIHYTFDKLYPYILISSIVFFLIFIFAFCIFIILLRINLTN
jgi:hypothetical protein